MEDAVLELGKLPAASLIKAINGLTGEEQRALRQISTKLVNAVNASGVTVKTVKPKPSSQSAAAITERKNQRLLGQFADAEASARLNMQLWNRGQSLIPTDHAELPKDKVVDEFSAIQYIKSAVAALRASQSVAFYDACVVGRRINQIKHWWDSQGKPGGKFTSWLQKNLVGHAEGQLTEDEIYRYVAIGRLQSLYPNIIFISAVKWTTIARYSAKFTNFITSDERRRMFWSSANTKMRFRVGTAPVIEGPHIRREGSSDLPSSEQMAIDLNPYQMLIDERDRAEERNRLNQLALQNDDDELRDECNQDDSD